MITIINRISLQRFDLRLFFIDRAFSFGQFLPFRNAMRILKTLEGRWGESVQTGRDEFVVRTHISVRINGCFVSCFACRQQ